MLKKILIGLGIIIGLIIIVAVISIYKMSPSESIVLEFLKENPHKSAIKLVRNDTIIAQKNINHMMPLASTVKIILAIEYAEQAAQGIINPDQNISLTELDRFYVANTDGGAHPNWLKSINDKIKNDSISIKEIAKGMIKYSSNANTEWLSDKLELKNINNRLDSLDIKNHSKFYHIVSALFVGKEKFPKLTGSELAAAIRNLSIEEYINTTDDIHNKLLSNINYKNDIGDLSIEIQRVWSDNLPSSTVCEYTEIMKKINSRTYFSSETQSYLDEVMEFLLENPANSSWLEHAGNKGGSTAFVLTKALYATDKKSNKTELVYFFNDLGPIERTRLQMSMNQFELKILTDKKFRKKVEEQLAN